MNVANMKNFSPFDLLKATKKYKQAWNNEQRNKHTLLRLFKCTEHATFIHNMQHSRQSASFDKSKVRLNELIATSCISWDFDYVATEVDSQTPNSTVGSIRRYHYCSIADVPPVSPICIRPCKHLSKYVSYNCPPIPQTHLSHKCWDVVRR